MIHMRTKVTLCLPPETGKSPNLPNDLFLWFLSPSGSYYPICNTMSNTRLERLKWVIWGGMS